jgi:nucleoid DNA-binding protein
MNTDVVVAVSDRATDELDALFNTDIGRGYLADRRAVAPEIVGALDHFGLSSICNTLAAIKTAKLLSLGPEDVLITVATDGAAMYPSERSKLIAERYSGDYRATEVLDGAGKVVLPGLINTHTHAAMSLLRGIADDKELMDWLVNYMFPVEVRFVDPDFVRLGTELSCWEMIRGGTTTFVDMYYFNDSVAEAVESCGLRALIATSVIDQPSPDAADAREGLQRAVEFIERWQGRNNRIIPVMGAHGVFTVKPRKTGIGRNPRTGAQVSIPPGKAVRFKPGKELQSLH